MGFLRFRRSIKLVPGVRINVSKSGISTSIGKPGATINFRRGRVTTTVGLPGTGLSYTEQTTGRISGRRLLLLLLILIVLVVAAAAKWK